MKSPAVFRICAVVLPLFLSGAAAYDALDPAGNITIRWDFISWTPDGYVAVVNITNYQKYRPVTEPGWRLGWTWAGREVIWRAVGAEATSQGDCSRFKGNIPHSCERRPTMVDLIQPVPLNLQVEGCCRGGVLAAVGVGNPAVSTAGFQLTVGNAGTNNHTVRIPRNVTFGVERGGYTCGPSRIVRPTIFVTPDGRRVTQALLTWTAVCTYSAFLARKEPACCVSLSSYDHQLSASCKNCACGCGNRPVVCPRKGNDGRSSGVACTNHMCPISINWNITSRGKSLWAAKVSISNFNHRMSISEWTLLLRLQQSNRLIAVDQANDKALLNSTSGWEMFWGIKRQNDVIRSERSKGSSVSWGVDYTFKQETTRNENKSRALYVPQAVYFNGAACSMPA